MDLRQTVPMEAVSIGGRQGFRFVDRYLRSEVLFHYVGDATFKGVAETTPVYGISWKREEANAPGGGTGTEGG
jgi:hypothetical protein